MPLKAAAQRHLRTAAAAVRQQLQRGGGGGSSSSRSSSRSSSSSKQASSKQQHTVGDDVLVLWVMSHAGAKAVWLVSQCTPGTGTVRTVMMTHRHSQSRCYTITSHSHGALHCPYVTTREHS